MTFSVAAGMRISQSLDEQVGGLDLLRAGEAVHGAVFLAVIAEGFQVDAVLVVQAAADFADADDFVASLMHEQGGVGADIAEALHDDAGALRDCRPSFWQASSQTIITPRPVASRRPREPPMLMRLAGDDRRDGLAHVHGVGIHHPGHDLLVGVDVGGGNVFFRPDEFDQFGGVAAGHALDFAHRHFVGIADHAALGAAEGDVDHGALPGHPAGEGADFVERDIGRIADAALCRAARDGVLHAEAGENFEMAVIHLHRDVTDDLAVGIAQNAPQAFVKIQLLGGQIEAGALRFPRVGFFIHMGRRGNRCHRNSLRNNGR